MLVQNKNDELITVKLNNFIHRISCKASIIEISSQYGGSLKRIRRSRNWRLMATQSQLIAMSGQLRENNIIWVADAIDNTLPKQAFDLTLIIRSTPAITVNQLIVKSGCTLAEARTAIDSAEGFL